MKVFISYGITVNSILTRYGSPKAMPYDWQILLEHAASAEDVYNMEVAFKTEMETFHYTPKISFHGSTTECYTKLSEALESMISY